jgi:hypothetical protein
MLEEMIVEMHSSSFIRALIEELQYRAAEFEQLHSGNFTRAAALKQMLSRNFTRAVSFKELHSRNFTRVNAKGASQEQMQ